MTKTTKKTAPAPTPALTTLPPAALVTEALQVLATAAIEALSTTDIGTLTADQVAELAASDAARLEAEQDEARRLADLAMQGEVDRMQNMAQRIWDGQSISLPTKTRVERLEKALLDQGFEPIMHRLREPEGFESAL
jgi:hypothetical protein